MIMAAYVPSVILDGSTSIIVAVSLTVIVGLFALKMVYDHRMKIAFLAASVASVLGYNLLAILAWQDVASRNGDMLMSMGDLSNPMPATQTIALTWAQLPEIAFRAPLIFAVFFAACAAYMQAGDYLSTVSRRRIHAKYQRMQSKG